MNFRKFFLYLLIVSVAVSALLGIAAFVFGNFGEFETKVLFTTFCITVTSILGLACGAYLETGRARLMPISGILCAVISGVLWIVLIWHGHQDGNVWVKMMMSVTVLAVAVALLSLLSIARLDRRFLWSRYVAHAAVWGLVGFVFYLIWLERDFDGDFIPRTFGVLGILIGAMTILTPIFHKLSNQLTGIDALDSEIAALEARLAELNARRDALNVEKIDAV